MSTRTSKKISLHKIDISRAGLDDKSVIRSDSDVDSYVDRLIRETLGSSRSRAFKPRSEHTEVLSQLINLDDSSWDDANEIIATRLFRTEKATQAKVEQLNGVRVGSLLQVFTQIDGFKTIIFAKVDHNDYLNEISLKQAAGLPINQREQKTALITFDTQNNIDQILLSDSNQTIARFWWDDFLEVEHLNSSERNTKSAFNVINKLITKRIKDKSPSDYLALRNAVVSYFRTSESFVFDDLYEQVFKNYLPDETSLNFDAIKKELKKLPEQNKFDTQFEITIAAIKAKIVSQIELVKNLELKFTGDVENLEEVIEADIDKSGRRYIRIYSDKGYESFKKVKLNEDQSD